MTPEWENFLLTLPRNILLEINAIEGKPTPVYIDNESAVNMAKRTISRQRTKHIDVRQKWLSQAQEQKKIVVRHVKGAENVADVLTKPLPAPRFISLRQILMNIMSILLMLSTVRGYLFAEIAPVFYTPTNIEYFTGTTYHETVLIVANICPMYFDNLLINKGRVLYTIATPPICINLHDLD